MGKKLALNVVYNVAIFICLILMYTGFANKHYEYIAGGLFIGAVFVILKVHLLKDVRNMQNKR